MNVTAKTAKYTEVAVVNPGLINGQVSFEGPIPENAVHLYTNLKSPEVCGSERKITWIDTQEGALRGVFVFINKIKSGKAWPDSVHNKSVLNQEHCDFTPKMQIIKQGTLEIRNSDEGVLHNVNAREMVGLEKGRKTAKSMFNIAQPEIGTIVREIKPRRVPYISFVCQNHEQMHSFMLALPHPYATMVDNEGRFSLNDIPPGQYTLKAWHPKLGVLKSKITVPSNGTVNTKFSFSASNKKTSK